MGKGWELTLCLRIDVLWALGKPMPEFDFNPISKLTLSPVRGLRKWALYSIEESSSTLTYRESPPSILYQMMYNTHMAIVS
jgi:hypothetical protein